MSAPHAQTIIGGYLRRLDDALQGLPRQRRREIVDDIEAHIADARAAFDDESDADLLNLVDRLGDPAEIAAEARERFGIDARPAGLRELAALLLLGPGNLIVPLLSWLAGALLVWRSQCWTEPQKRRGVYIPLVAVLAVAVLLWLPTVDAFHGSAWLLLVVLLPTLSSLYLAIHLGRRLPSLAWLGAVVATLVIAVPCAIAVLPAHAYAWVEYNAAARCGSLYGTETFGGSAGGSAGANVGYCVDGNRVRVTWGPNCPVGDSTGWLRVHLVACRVVQRQDGTLALELTTSGRSLTSPIFERSTGVEWLILPDGSFVHGDDF